MSEDVKDHPMFGSAQHQQIEREMAARKDVIENLDNLNYYDPNFAFASAQEKKQHTTLLLNGHQAQQAKLDKLFESKETKNRRAAETVEHDAGIGRVDHAPTHEPLTESFVAASEHRASYEADAADDA